jgi:N-acetyl-anhydromuramyl-L-alanine amidase AmpD
MNFKIYRVVEDEKRAWHAGVSDWGAASSLNYESIGIEIVNHGNHPFPDEQVWIS